MAKVSARPESVVRRGTAGTFTAYPQMAANPNTGATELQSWTIQGPDGNVGVVPAAQFASDGTRMLEAYAAGQGFEPSVTVAGEALAPQLAWEKRRDLLGEGRNHTRTVAPFTRSLAVSEADEEGMFRRALERHAVEQWPGLQRELFGRLYGDAEPLAEVAEGDRWLQVVHENVDEVSEWEDLQARSEGDPWAAGIGAARVTEVLGKVLDEAIRKLAPQEDPERVEQEAQELEEEAEGAGVVEAERAEQLRAQAEALATALGSEETQLQIRDAVRAGAAQAEAEIAAVEAAVAGLGAGGGMGMLSGVDAPKEDVRKAVMADPKLRRIAELAGRLRMRARDKQRRKVRYQPEQIVDVTVGAEINRLLPSELMLLGTEETELLLLKRLTERQALQYELEGSEAEDQGPILLLVDSSGSMEGPRNEWAMAVGLALMEVCAMQRRGFGLCHYDGQVQKTFLVKASQRITLPELIEMVSYFSGGGTAFSPPVNWAAEQIEGGTWSKADVVLVTDGGTGDNWSKAADRVHAAGANLFGVAIECDFAEGDKRLLQGIARITDLAGAAQKGQGAQAHRRQGPKRAGDGQIDLVFGQV